LTVSIADVYEHHSLVIASDFRVPDPAAMRPVLQRLEGALAELGTHHVLTYRSTREHGRVLVMLGVHNHEPIVEVMRSHVFLEWFDEVGVRDIPAVFAGEIVARLDVADLPAPPRPAVLVSAIVPVADIAFLTDQLRGAAARFAQAGVHTVWVFRSFDDPQEAMILQEIDDEASARRWIEHPDAAAVWMRNTGVGVYPPLFVGEFDSLVRIDSA
jgi:hypothetical protein